MQKNLQAEIENSNRVESTPCSLYFFHFRKNKYWAFKQMRLALKPLKESPELDFFKLMGCGGGNGFSMVPDFSTYALLCVWKKGFSPEDFEKDNDLYHSYFQRSSGIRRFDLHPVVGKGSWGGGVPFEMQPVLKGDYPWAVLTRASIKWWKVPGFWASVPGVSDSASGFPGSTFSIGIGEWPLIEQATFSVWKNPDSINQFAYQSRHHKNVIKKTRQRNWYSEELFVRFQVLNDEWLSNADTTGGDF